MCCSQCWVFVSPVVNDVAATGGSVCLHQRKREQLEEEEELMKGEKNTNQQILFMDSLRLFIIPTTWPNQRWAHGPPLNPSPLFQWRHTPDFVVARLLWDGRLLCVFVWCDPPVPRPPPPVPAVTSPLTTTHSSMHQPSLVSTSHTFSLSLSLFQRWRCCFHYSCLPHSMLMGPHPSTPSF